MNSNCIGMSAQKQETFEGIDFAQIHEVTSLENDEIKVLKICFNMFDVKDQGFLSSTDLVRTEREEGRDFPFFFSLLF